MFNKIREKISLYTLKNPQGVVLTNIIVFNAIILFVNSFIIFFLLRQSSQELGFWKVLYYTVGMILDAGMIENIVDVSESGLILITICLITIIIGSVTFTGAVIGYVTNRISGFVDDANTNFRQLIASNHTVILNWNSRASEIINDMLYTQKNEVIVVMVNGNSEKVRNEINERIYLTLQTEKNLKNKLSIVVKEGSTYSIKQLKDISLEKAKTVIILGDDDSESVCKYSEVERNSKTGDANTIKTLVQVSQITSAADSLDNQRIIVETEDYWTGNLVDKIISHKEVLEKCNIVPISVNSILGQLLSQFCIFPELNIVYSELFSNKGSEFFCIPKEEMGDDSDEEECIRHIIENNENIIPLSFLQSKTGNMFYYMALEEKDFFQKGGINEESESFSVKIRSDYGREKKNIIILGYNTKIKDIMNGFNSFSDEWRAEDGSELLNIMVIDDEKNLEKNNYYNDYKYITKCVAAEIYDTKTIKNAIIEFVDKYDEDTSILILSDDRANEKDMDSHALTNLIYVHDIICDKIKENPDFDKEKIDVIVEILNPKNYDVVHNYNVNNIVISNRYISKMVTQIGEKIELFEFYNDILRYDSEDNNGYESREIYIRQVKNYLEDYPSKCSVYDLVRAVFDASPKDNKAILLGIVKAGGKLELFERNQQSEIVEIQPKDKLVIYSKH